MSKKPTRGVLIFAIDTDTRSYSTMANYCATKIRQHLDLPVTVVTTGEVDEKLFDRVITVDFAERQQRTTVVGRVEQWRNFNRHQAYELSPYDETILLDTDYICNSDQLLKLFDLGQEFLCHRTRRYLGAHYESTVEYFARNHEMYWATVVYFKRCAAAESIFSMIRMIQENYSHYSKIYGFRPHTYRNDYALSIALNTVYGHAIPSSVEIPWPLANVEFDTEVELSDDSWTISFERRSGPSSKKYRITTNNQDLHLLNKDALERIIDETAD